MKANAKDITISITALLLLFFAVTAFFKVINSRQSSLHVQLHALIPPNAEVILSINRPDLFRKMELGEPLVYGIYAEDIPDVYLSILKMQNVESAVISFHRQGELCCIKTGDEGDGIIKALDGMFKEYAPQKQTANDIDFYYFPDTANRFFGYYIYDNVWVGSYSRKLLMKAAEQQLRGEVVFNGEAKALLRTIDKNSPSNIILKAGSIGIDSFANDWLSIDLFVNDGNFCIHTRLPYFDDEINDALSSYLEDKYPHLQFSFQISDDRDDVYLTACCGLNSSD